MTTTARVLVVRISGGGCRSTDSFGGAMGEFVGDCTSRASGRFCSPRGSCLDIILANVYVAVCVRAVEGVVSMQPLLLQPINRDLLQTRASCIKCGRNVKRNSGKDNRCLKSDHF